MEKQKLSWNYNAIFIVFLLGVSAFSLFKYLYSIKERYSLADTLSREKARMALLETQKAELLRMVEVESGLAVKLRENNLLYKNSLRAGKNKVLKLTIAYQEVYNLGKSLDSQISFLNSENSILKASSKELELQVSEVLRENGSLKAKLSSAKEIKKVIKDVRKKERSALNNPVKEIIVVQAVQQVEVAPVVREVEIVNPSKGNGGFLLKNGKSNYLK